MIEHYYQTLGINAEADERTLKKAFRNLAFKLHPDVNSDPEANEKFRELCEAYEVILQKIRMENSVEAGRPEKDEVDLEDDMTIEEILSEARRKAFESARIRHEKMEAEKEFFEESNLRDVMRLFQYAGRILAFPLAVFLIAAPVIAGIKYGIQVFFGLFFFLIVGGILLNQIWSNRRKWFKLGKIRWNLKDFVHILNFSPIDKNARTDCYYSKGQKATGKDFVIVLIKVKDVAIRNDGLMQHYVAYKRIYRNIMFPRSTKAFRIHFIQSMLKVLSLIICLIWLPVPSIIWRFIFGLVSGLILSETLCRLTKTKSKVSYLLNWFIVIKVIVWLIALISQTIVYPGFVLQTTPYAPLFLIFLILFGDLVMDFIFKLTPFYSNIYIPITWQSPNVLNFYKNGFRNYLDIPVWSTIYPLARWFV